MSGSSTTMPEAFEPRPLPQSAIARTRPFYWSLRREFWENRYLYIAPVAVAAVTLIGFLIATLGRALSTADLNQRRAILEGPYELPQALLMGTAMFVGVYYCLEAFQGERRDRSILFWKSLPVSDVTTVLSKATIPALLQLIAWAATAVLTFVMLVFASLGAASSGLSVADLWQRAAFLQASFSLLYHLMTLHTLWHAPFYAWALLVSAWARRAAILWATVPVVAVVLFERIVFHSAHFAYYLLYRLAGPEDYLVGAHAEHMNHGTLPFHPGTFFSSPGLWGGLLFTALCLLLAIRLRRQRTPL
jgi:ABC-2 type transport system permease protein